MNQPVNGLASRGKVLMVVAALMASACADKHTIDTSVQVGMTECARIADRSERARCIDAANRSGHLQVP